jgi:hypothetical protein
METVMGTILQLETSIYKSLSSVIIQMRTEKISLRQFLFQRKDDGHNRIYPSRLHCRITNRVLSGVIHLCVPYPRHWHVKLARDSIT